MVNRDWSVKEDNDPLVVPSFETISFTLPTMGSWESFIRGERDGWCYLSDSNPSLAALEKLLAKTQSVESCWVTSTGKSAIAATLLALLNAGDNLILLKEGYKSTRLFAEGVLQRFGVSITLIGVDDLPQLAKHIQPGKTKALVLEAPTNPITRVPDLYASAAVARNLGVTTVLDNSLAGFHQHGDVPVDVIVHSLSKFASGVGDVMGGAVMGSALKVSFIKSRNTWNSDALSAHSAVELWKGMQTYKLRTQQQSSNALAIARFLAEQREVSRVMYPGLPSHPDHKIALRQMTDFGSVLAFDIAAGAEAMRAVLDQLKVFRIAFGTGFTQSIANPAWLFYARSFPEEQTGSSAINNNTIRLSVGIEPPEELIEDLKQALRAAERYESPLAASR